MKQFLIMTSQFVHLSGYEDFPDPRLRTDGGYLKSVAAGLHILTYWIETLYKTLYIKLEYGKTKTWLEQEDDAG